MSTVAVVDDDDDVRGLMVVKLRVAGYVVAEESNGTDGLRLVEELVPDLVVLDWMMPGLSGIEVCRAIRENPALAGTPVLIVSSRAGASDADVCWSAGASAFLRKPFAMAELVEAAAGLVAPPRDPEP